MFDFYLFLSLFVYLCIALDFLRSLFPSHLLIFLAPFVFLSLSPLPPSLISLPKLSFFSFLSFSLSYWHSLFHLIFCFPLFRSLFFSLSTFFSFSIIRSLSVSHSFSFYLYLSPFFLILTLFLPPPLPSYLLPFLSLHFLSLLVFPLPLLHSNVATEAPGSCMLPFSLKMA